MFKTRKKLATLAVAAAMSGGAMMMAAPAHALNVSQNNLGEVLFFPLYTVKNGLSTVFTLTNTTNKTAVLKIRFREGLNSREVRDFNVILSPNDHWGAAVTADSAGGALVRTNDKSCTSPILPPSADANLAALGYREIGFTNYLYSSSSVGKTPGGLDGAGTGLDRLQEGYFEVFLMGLSSVLTPTSSNTVEYYSTHVAGTPRNCTLVDQQFAEDKVPNGPIVAGTPFSNFGAPADILKGHVTYFNGLNGQSIDTEPTALEHWLDYSSMIFSPGNNQPNLYSGDQTVARGVSTWLPTQVYEKNYNNSVDAASSVLSAQAILNEYASGTGAATSWVVTFPTKHHYTDDGRKATSLADVAALPPFTENFVKPTSLANYGKSCDAVTPVIYDREETFKSQNGFSPVETGNYLCYEVNIIDFNGSTIFGTGPAHVGMPTTDIGNNGWMRLGLDSTRGIGFETTPIPLDQSVDGLPVIGFSAFMRTGAGATVNYGSQSAHAYDSGQH